MSAAYLQQSLLLALRSAGVDLRQLRMRSEYTASVGSSRYSAPSPAERRRRRRSSSGITGTLDSVVAIRRREMLEGSGRRSRPSLVRRMVGDLRRLVPVDANGSRRLPLAEDVRGLLWEAAEYIACLQQQIKVMRSMVDALSERSGC